MLFLLVDVMRVYFYRLHEVIMYLILVFEYNIIECISLAWKLITSGSGKSQGILMILVETLYLSLLD